MKKKIPIAVVVLVITLCLSTAMAFELGFNFGFGGSNRVKWIDLLPVLSGWSPSSKAFGNVSTGVVKRQVFTVSNSGNTHAEDVAVSVTGSGFTLYSTPTLGNISSGRTLTVKVRFAPAVQQSYSGHLTYSAPNIPAVSASLTGVGITPETTTITDDFSADTTANYTGFYLQSGGTGYTSYDAVNDRMRGNSADYRSAIYHNTELASDDHTVTARLMVSGLSNNSQIVFRYSPANGTGYIAGRSTSNTTSFYIKPFSGNNPYAPGTPQGWFTFTGGKTWATNANYLTRVSITGNSIKAYIDWNNDGDFDDADEDLGTAITLSSYSTGKHVGFYFFQFPAVWVDDLVAQ